MKTIILCGGRGWRMHEETEFRPKAMVEIGGVPILLHIMGMYAAHGYKDFVLCLGYKGDMIREYFLNLPNLEQDIELDMATGKTRVLGRSYQLDYTISFVDTGLESDTAERVLIASKYIPDEQFMVSYGDDVSDVDITKLLKFHERRRGRHKSYATLTAAHPSSHYGRIWADKRDVIRKFDEKPTLEDYVNGGFMVFEKKALQSLRKGETLEDGLERLASKRRLSQYKHDGFWHAMNTVKDVQYLNELWKKGRPWVRRTKRVKRGARGKR